MEKILIKNGKIWDGHRFFYSDIMTHGNIIAKIESQISDVADFTYDASGKIVSAGLVDSHVHMKGISIDKYGMNAEMISLPFGVTAAVDASGVLGDKALLDAFTVKNLVYVCAEFKNNKAHFDYARMMLHQYGNKAIGIKAFYDIQQSEVETVAPLYEVVEFATKNNLKVMVHSSNPPIPMSELTKALRSGDIITHAYHGGKNTVMDDKFKCITEAKKRGIFIDAGFAGNAHTNFKVFQNAVLSKAEPDIISSDITNYSAYTRGGRYGITMCMSIAKDIGMKEDSIFRAVTSNPATALGMNEEWGYLKVGRCADIAVLEYANEPYKLIDNEGNVVNNSKGYRCVMTVINGQIIYKT